MIRYICGLAALASWISIAASSSSHFTYTDDTPPPPQLGGISKGPVYIRTTISQAEIVLGDSVRFAEFVPRKPFISPTMLTHDVYILAIYDEKSRGFVNKKSPSLILNEGFDEKFTSIYRLSGDIAVFNATNPRELGIESTIKPAKLGIYLLYAKWLVGEERKQLNSGPLLLVVKHPEANNPNPVTKKEWLWTDE